MTYRSAGLLLGALVLLPGPASAASPRVETMVVGKRSVLAASKIVSARAERLPGGCRVVAGTALAALVATEQRLRVTDDGACTPSSLFVTRVGADTNRGQAGWVYKVGPRAGTAGAGDPAGAFGTGRRLRTGDRVLWFWCVRAARCQRTLAVTAHLVAPGRLRASVRAYDDNGRGVRVAGATIAAGGGRALTGPDGSAMLGLDPGETVVHVVATKAGLVRSFPERVAA